MYTSVINLVCCMMQVLYCVLDTTHFANAWELTTQGRQILFLFHGTWVYLVMASCIHNQILCHLVSQTDTKYSYLYFIKSVCHIHTVYPKKYAHSFCFAVLCCDYTLTDFPISIRLTSLALWQSNDCPSASKATLMNMDKYFMWIHYERLHNHNKAKHNKTVCIFLGIYCIRNANFVITVTVDVPAPNGARPPASTVFNEINVYLPSHLAFMNRGASFKIAEMTSRRFECWHIVA